MIIDCDICGDVIETTAKVIVTPFECAWCKNEAANEDACDYSAIAAAPSDEYATSEATVELVQDLQQQLADAQELAADRLKEIEFLDRSVESYRKIAETSEAYGEGAIKERDEAQAWETKSHRYLALALERVEEDTKVIEELKDKIAHLEISNTILKVPIDWYEELLGYARS
jgi:DNA-directed RNA polymerase subunit M/transcription elongation factor TFIIS